VIYNPGDDRGTTVTTDQRGIPRPRTRTQSLCDIGAYELQGSTPIVSAIDPQTTAEDTPTAAIPFTVVDAETPPGNLAVTATSSNQAFVPNVSIVLGGGGEHRPVRMTPSVNQSGPVDITLTVTRTTPGQPTTITLTIVDECGPWPTFVGGGPTAF